MRYVSVIFVVILLVALAACGGDDDEEEEVIAQEPTPAPTATAEPEPTATATPVVELTWEDVVEILEPSTVMVRADFPETAVSYEGQGSGTGIVYSENGYILTNAHVVSGAAALTVSTAGSSRERSARFIGVSPCDDLAVIQVSDMDGLEVATLGDSGAERVGAEVAALGYPLGDMLSLDLTFSRGAISKMNESLWHYERLIQHDASINPGNSGGPLVNKNAEVIGVNTGSVDPSQATNINFAIDINGAKPIIRELEEGKNRHWLGMNLEPNFYPDYFGTEDGLVVAAVASGSSASSVGVRAPYLLTHLQGLSVNSMDDVCRILRSHGDGDSLKVEFTHITATELQILEGEIVLGDATRGISLEIVHRVAFFEEEDPTPNDEPEQLTVGRWEGVATVTVDYWAPCGANNDWEYYDTQTWTHTTNVIVDIPLEDEYNLYWMEVWSDSEEEGGFWLLSSWQYSDGHLGEYWDLANDGARVTGMLIAYPESDAELGNVLYSNLPVDPCSDAQGFELAALQMDIGSTVDGTLGATEGSLVITGMTEDLFRDFLIEIELTRTQ